MVYVNIEIKARSRTPDFIRQYLKQYADFRGTDLQTDTYFNTPTGRLKLREGNIEKNLIYYERGDEPGQKESNFQLMPLIDALKLKDILSAALGVKIVVEKRREIYFIRNVKFHLDHIDSLGDFVEIEASNLYADASKEELQSQCSFFISAFGIAEQDFVAGSYSDMLLSLNNDPGICRDDSVDTINGFQH